MLQKPGSGSCKAHDYGTGQGGEVDLEGCMIRGMHARVWEVSRVWVCEGTYLQGPWRGQESGMVQEPTIGSEKSLGGYRLRLRLN